jgi:hypothetical protein
LFRHAITFKEGVSAQFAAGRAAGATRYKLAQAGLSCHQANARFSRELRPSALVLLSQKAADGKI